MSLTEEYTKNERKSQMNHLKTLGMYFGIFSVMIGAMAHENLLFTGICVLVGALAALPGIIEANRDADY